MQRLVAGREIRGAVREAVAVVSTTNDKGIVSVADARAVLDALDTASLRLAQRVFGCYDGRITIELVRIATHVVVVVADWNKT